MAKPRVFISSTYYDLKYVRERLERFIRSYNCEPILFESDKVYFHPNQSIDKSCYDEVKTCHLMILIIGGRYGSIATEQDKELYENNTISITQKEFETAIQMGIPVMTFIDMKVYADYETYINNLMLLKDFVFAHVDDVKIFTFISNVNRSAVKTFDKIEDIEQYFSNQISGMLYDYLVGLQKKKENEDIQHSVEQLNSVSDNMQKMLNTIAENILGQTAKEKYEELLLEQKQSSIDFFIKVVEQEWVIIKADNYDRSQVSEYADIVCEQLISTIFNRPFCVEYRKQNGWKERYDYLHEKEEVITRKIQGKIPSVTIRLHLTTYIDHLDKILDIIGENSILHAYFRTQLYEMLLGDLELPF